ncbi:MAG: hypothetical protein JW804_06365 [Sedimentisphaerales bacterium]|nr:hypothetical protein [Sedimentisphaerales bacterium]
MEIPENHKKKVLELFEQSDCTKKPNCIDKNFKHLPDIRQISSTDLFECNQSQGCPYALSFGNSAFCKCPVRTYLKKNCGI